jgi:hypothetical protein
LRVTSRGLGDVYKRQASDAAGQVKNVNKIRELTQKLAKGGLVERR